MLWEHGAGGSNPFTPTISVRVKERGPVVKRSKTSPFHGGNSGSIPDGVTIFPQQGITFRAFNSVGQSGRLITGWSGVQVPEGPPLRPGSSVGLECQPVTLEVEGSSPFRVAISLPFG